MLSRYLAGLFLLAGASLAAADDSAQPPTLWLVGPEQALTVPSEAAKLARDGDTVEIMAGHYVNDYAFWYQNNLTIRGVGGMAHLNATELIVNNKAIWIITGDNVTIENVEFSGARVSSTNGAGIRHNGGDLTLRNTFFHDNEFSVLTGPGADTDIHISDSRFWFQRRSTRFSHGIYIGAVKRFTLVGSHIKGTDLGHQVKSRALENHILYNRIEDIEEGNSSRLIDLPNCGFSLVMGNEMHQGAQTSNTDVIGFGAEGCDERTERQRQLFVVNNTLINMVLGATFVRNHAQGSATVNNNLLFGGGQYLSGRGEASNNLRLRLPSNDHRQWAPPAGSRAIDRAEPLTVPGLEAVPTREFDPPFGTRERPQRGRLDIGAREATINVNPLRHGQ